MRATLEGAKRSSGGSGAKLVRVRIRGRVRVSGAKAAMVGGAIVG